MRKAFLFLLAPCLLLAQASKPLDIYVVDVEGGNATLFVAPTGESLLIDTGNAGAQAAVRDATRIVEAAKAAGLSKIDHVIITHWHGDHFGGLEELAARMPIGEFIDHGPNVQPGELPDNFLKNVYPKLYAKSKHTVAKPGDKIALGGVDVRVVSSAGEIIKSPLAGGGKPNPTCASFKTSESNQEDPMSVSVYVTYGKFRTYHEGDLPKAKEFEVMCPNAKLAPVDVLLGLHHGVATSNSPVMIHGLHPRVAIMNNGTRKGGDPDVMMAIHTSPGLEDLWQIHFSTLSGQEYTMPGMFIANTADDQPAGMPIAAVKAPAPGPNAPPPPAHNGKAYWIKLSAQSNGSFTVTNTRNNFSKTY
ncbi:MAG: MBL fold metallo-hydrolase [Bryobacterales bacterium]|nr:MBL fold metallo-hydrolase [Bryobacterales bacterium]